MHQTRVPSPAEGFVYVMQCGPHYKIGWAKRNPRKRLATVQIGNPMPVTLVGVIEGSKAIERDWQQAFRDKRVRGEWFTLTELDVARILHESYAMDDIPDYEAADDKVPFDVDYWPDYIPPDDEPA